MEYAVLSLLCEISGRPGSKEKESGPKMPRAISYGLKLMTVSALAIAIGVTTTGTTAGTTTTGSTSGSTAVAGVETAPQMGAGVRHVPSTKILNDSAPLAILGVALMGIGGALLRRPRGMPYR
jgi:hypothetical protein